MIESGDAKAMGGTAFLVYCVVKSYTNWSTGRSFPGIDLISDKTGLSKRQVIRCLERLQELDYVSVEKIGRKNRYTLREKITITDSEGQPKAAAVWDYLPSMVEAARAELKNFLVSGDASDAKIVNIVNIENFTVNLNVQHNARDGYQLDPEKYPNIKHLVAKTEKARESSTGKGSEE
jgi:hypothetical protein